MIGNAVSSRPAMKISYLADVPALATASGHAGRERRRSNRKLLLPVAALCSLTLRFSEAASWASAPG